MSPIKTQLEVRYTHILNFSSIYRAIISPYLKLARFNINNTDTIEEQIILTFKEEGFTIDARWDRLVFICDGKKDNLFTSTGPLIHFFDILDKLQKSSSFGEITSLLLAEWILIQSEKSEMEVIQEFKDKHLKASVPLISDYELNDIGIIINLKEKSNFLKMQYGPFVASQDIPAYNLTPISSKEISELLRGNGVLIQAVVFETCKNVDTDSFKKMDKKALNFIKQLQ